MPAWSSRGHPANDAAGEKTGKGWRTLMHRSGRALRTQSAQPPALLREARDAVAGRYGEVPVRLLTEVYPGRLLGKVAEVA